MITRRTVALALFVLAGTTLFAQEPAAPGVTPAVEAALLKEDWAKVADLLPDAVCSNSSVARLIKGHACLALNRNNESLTLFQGTTLPEDIAAWKSYARGLRLRAPDQPIADYFLGDSFAREGDYSHAIDAFDEGLRAHRAHALLLNALGVCLARKGKIAEARARFEDALKVAPALADASACIGACWIAQCDGIEAACAQFSRAVEQNPDFALALLQRGALNLQAGRQSDATRDLAKAFLLVDWLSVHPDVNGYVQCAMRSVGIEPSELVLANSPDGTFMEKTFSREARVEHWAWCARTLDDMGLKNGGDSCRQIIANHVRDMYAAGGAPAVSALRGNLGPSGKQLDESAKFMPSLTRSRYEHEVAPKPLNIEVPALANLPKDETTYSVIRLSKDLLKPNIMSPNDAKQNILRHDWIVVINDKTKEPCLTISFDSKNGGELMTGAHQKEMTDLNLEAIKNRQFKTEVSGLTRADVVNLHARTKDFAQKPTPYFAAYVPLGSDWNDKNCQGTAGDFAAAARGIKLVRNMREDVLPRVERSTGPIKTALEVGIRAGKGDFSSGTTRPERRTERTSASLPDLSKPIGGANLSLSGARWDNGDWPFKPLYGLAYGMTAVEPAEARYVSEAKSEAGDGK